ncbi:hypothetical protein BH23ACT9_BH23ACT9_15180 [soil metagenome]
MEHHEEDTAAIRRGAPPSRFPVGRVAAILLVLALVFAAGLAGQAALGNLFGWSLGAQTVDRSQPAVLVAVRDMAELRAASGQYHVILDVEEDVPILPAAIAGRRTLFVALGTVDAAVDLSALGEDSVEVGEDGTSVRMTLPPARFTEPRIDPDGSYVYDRQQGLVDRIGALLASNLPDDQALYQQATDMLADAAAESDLRERAESNTRQVLTSLLTSLGFTDIEIEFAPGP